MRLQGMLLKALMPDHARLRRVKLDLDCNYLGEEVCCVWLWDGDGHGEIMDHYTWTDISSMSYKQLVNEAVTIFKVRSYE